MLDRLRHVVARDRSRRQLVHGWEVELTCPRCGLTAIPQCLGWTSTAAVGLGNRPTIYADVACPACGDSLKEAASARLVELFTPLRVPSNNRSAIILYLLLTIAMIIAAAALLARPAWAWLSLVPLLALRPLTSWFNRRVTTLRENCPCGEPQHKFMGMLGRSMCFRCSHCGRLLRLRD